MFEMPSVWLAPNFASMKPAACNKATTSNPGHSLPLSEPTRVLTDEPACDVSEVKPVDGVAVAPCTMLIGMGIHELLLSAAAYLVAA